MKNYKKMSVKKQFDFLFLLSYVFLSLNVYHYDHDVYLQQINSSGFPGRVAKGARFFFSVWKVHKSAPVIKCKFSL